MNDKWHYPVLLVMMMGAALLVVALVTASITLNVIEDSPPTTRQFEAPANTVVIDEELHVQCRQMLADAPSFAYADCWFDDGLVLLDIKDCPGGWAYYRVLVDGDQWIGVPETDNKWWLISEDSPSLAELCEGIL